MPRRKFIDPATSTTYTLVHRAQNDPLLHSEDAPSMVLAEKAATPKQRRPTSDDDAYSSSASAFSAESSSGYRSKKTKQRGDLEGEFGLAVRANEGEAAEHGVFWDDSGYDYMQHLRGLGEGEGAVTWVEGKSSSQQPRKGKQRLEDALRGLQVEDGRFDDASSFASRDSTSTSARSLLPEEMFGSDFVKKRSYQDQQDVPDEIAGFQPDMDPDLREVLEALEDEAYVDDEEDIFAELTSDGVEYEKTEWEQMGSSGWDDDNDEDERSEKSEDTIRASSPPPSLPLELPEGDIAKPPEDTQAVPPADPTDGAWLDEFHKFQSAAKSSTLKPAAPASGVPSALESSALSSLATGRKKKRKGAKTSTTNYSMTSSALARTDQQTLLDDRFDRIESTYSAVELPDDIEKEDGQFDDAVSMTSGLSKASQLSKYSAASGVSNASRMSSYSLASDADAPREQRSDFDSIMDEFLGGHSKAGRHGRRIKRGGPMTGMQQLDEVRKGLGSARVTTGKAS